MLSATIARASFKLLLLGTAGFGLAELLLAPAQTLALAAACSSSAGLCFTRLDVERQLVAPARACPTAIRGRVLGLYFYAFLGLQPIGGLVSGWLADTGGTSLAFAVGGTVTLVATGVAFVASGESRVCGLVGLHLYAYLIDLFVAEHCSAPS